MNLKEWNKRQLEESRSDMNRYFFWLHYRREAKNDQELLAYYIEFGGASDYNRNHRKEYEEEKPPPTDCPSP